MNFGSLINIILITIPLFPNYFLNMLMPAIINPMAPMTNHAFRGRNINSKITIRNIIIIGIHKCFLYLNQILHFTTSHPYLQRQQKNRKIRYSKINMQMHNKTYKIHVGKIIINIINPIILKTRPSNFLCKYLILPPFIHYDTSPKQESGYGRSCEIEKVGLLRAR